MLLNVYFNFFAAALHFKEMYKMFLNNLNLITDWEDTAIECTSERPPVPLKPHSDQNPGFLESAI